MSPSAGVGSTSSASGNLIKGEEGHLQQDEQQRCKMAVKSTSPDSVGSGEGSNNGGKSLKQTSELSHSMLLPSVYSGQRPICVIKSCS